MNRYDQDPPEAEPKGYWCHNEEPGRNAGHVVHYASQKEYDQQFEVTFYHGRDDGKPVIQIDGDGDWRINVNESCIYDRSTDEESRVHIAALAMYKQLAGIDHKHYFNLHALREELVNIGFTLPPLD